MKNILVYGEVLFDVFPDGKEILGGAPFNFAWHLQGFGYQPLLLTALGTDDLGSKALAAMKEWGLNCDGIHFNSTAPTGQVTVKFEAGQPSYLIDPSQAWGQISLDSHNLADGAESPPLLYHGSLALCSEQARQSIDQLIHRNNLSVFVDLNLRPPWWEINQIEKMLKRANYLKLNEEELNLVCQGLNCPDSGSLEQQASWLLKRSDLQLIIVTRGENGAFALSSDQGLVTVATPTIDQGAFVDSVGAGDAFAAVCAIGLLGGWQMGQTLKRAAHFAAQICMIQGATSSNQAIYQLERASWEDKYGA